MLNMATDSLKNSNNDQSPQAPADSVVVITGAGGVVGKQLVEHLVSLGNQVRVLSRNPVAIQDSLPEQVAASSYDEMESVLEGAHVVVHLAARNNDQGGDSSDFDRDNVDLSLKLASAANQSGVSKFVFATTTKALTDNCEHYGKSKAIAERKLASLAEPEFRVCLVRLCPVYGDGTRGKIKLLQNLPLGLGNLALWLVRSLVPIVSAQRVAEGIAGITESSDPLEETCLADPVGTFSVYGLYIAVMNFVFVVAVPTILGLPCLISAIAVATTSKGGVMFIQERVGKKKKPFKLCKFRTMFTGTPNAGTHEVGKSYVTKVGAFLRKAKIDELPQALNVLKREINLIGPRPGLAKQTELLKQRDRYGVYDILPGITGYGQVSGVDMSEPLRLAILDHRYAAFRGILLDTKIALKTATGGGFGDPVGGDAASASREIESAAEENSQNQAESKSESSSVASPKSLKSQAESIESMGAKK